MGSLALFPRRAKNGYVYIDAPIGAKPSDRFGVLTIEDDIYPKIPVGVTVTFKFNSREDKCPHVVEVDEGWIIAVCSFLSNGLVRVEPMRPDYPTITDTEDKLNILGCIIDLYSDPELTHRWVLWREWMESLLSPRSPPEHAPRRGLVMTWQMDAKGVVTYADPLARQFLGLTDAELRAGLWKNRLHPDDREQYLRSRERALAENTIYQNTVRVLDARDEYCLISVVVAPIRGEGGLVTGWHSVAQLAEGLIRQSA